MKTGVDPCMAHLDTVFAAFGGTPLHRRMPLCLSAVAIRIPLYHLLLGGTRRIPTPPRSGPTACSEGVVAFESLPWRLRVMP